MNELLFISVAAACITVASAKADIIGYRDGRNVRGIILEESETAVRALLHGREVTIPRSVVISTTRESREENDALRNLWKKSRAREESVPPTGTDMEEERTPASTAPVASPSSAPAISKRVATPAPRAEKTEPHEHSRRLMRKSEIRKAIAEKRIVMGMTQREVKAAWGWPERVHPVGGVETHSDRWTYRRKGEGFVDLYFRDGILERVVR